MAADLGHLAQAQAGLVGGGEGGAAEAVGAHSLDAHLLGQLGDGHLSAPDAERLASLAREDPALLRGAACLHREQLEACSATPAPNNAGPEEVSKYLQRFACFLECCALTATATIKQVQSCHFCAKVVKCDREDVP